VNVWTKRLEVAINVAILIAFLMVAVLAGQRLFHSHTNTTRAIPQVGSKVSLAGVVWSNSNRNLVLALSTTCHFCSESAGFYRKIVPEASTHGIPVIAVLPQTPSEARSYLDGLGIQVQQVFQGPINSVEATGTPTLLVIDSNGRISKAWVGKLDAEREGQVIAALN
jgi:hypothetical protein